LIAYDWIVIREYVSEDELRNISTNFRTAICLLIVNRIEVLPQLAVESIFSCSPFPVVVGYVHESDLEQIPSRPNLYFFKLSAEQANVQAESGLDYQDFSTDNFFELVKLKWILFRKLMEANFEHIIYSDLDVVWQEDLAAEMYTAHSERPGVHIFVQSFTSEPSTPRLCMGFISFKNSDTVADFFKLAELNHKVFSSGDKHFGDDDAITMTYKDQGYPSLLEELPQSTFPVGSMLDLYTKKKAFPGLSTPIAKLFHANYVVGLENKLILLQLFLGKSNSKRLGLQFQLRYSLLLNLRKIKYFILRLKSFLSASDN
jgi:hypothetical protein